MDIHKPKPFHGWSEFLKEYGIIVLGVLTALALEQAVVSIREYGLAGEARRSIRAELAADLGLMETREAVEPCVTRRLDEAQALIGRSAETNAPIWIGHPPAFPMRDSQFRSVAQAGHASLFSIKEQAAYARIYAYLNLYNEAENREQAALADLRTLEQKPPMTAEVAWRLRSALQQARTARWMLEVTDSSAHRVAGELGVGVARGRLFKMQSICVPIHSSRADALRLVAQGRPGNRAYDEP